jgi:hypothetical protein
MELTRHELLEHIAELRCLCAQAPMPDLFDRIDRAARAIQLGCGIPAVAAQALDVRFRAEDVFARPHLMPELVLREMLSERLHRLEATARASTAAVPLVPVDRRSNGRSGRRASDRLAGSRTEL